MKILLIEDSIDITEALSRALANNYVLDIALNGQNGYNRALASDHDVIVLDLNLPDITGIELCQELRNQGCKTPILILTADSRVLSKISLLDAGADDYLTKPFSLGELKVRLRVLQRRSSNHILQPNRMQVSDLTLDSNQHLVDRAGERIILRRKEFALLECLMNHAGMVVTREMLCDYAWHGSDTPWKNTVDVHIKYLRDKVDRPFALPLIKTVHGLGYKLDAQRVLQPIERPY